MKISDVNQNYVFFRHDSSRNRNVFQIIEKENESIIKRNVYWWDDEHNTLLIGQDRCWIDDFVEIPQLHQATINDKIKIMKFLFSVNQIIDRRE